MTSFPVPMLLVSRCLGYKNCRWDGGIVECSPLHRLEPYVRLTTVCPEVEIGLGIPRKPINVHEVDGELRLLQASTCLDLTQEMKEFSESFLEALHDIDGLILKSKSPSCGYKNTKIFHNSGFHRGSGLFAKAATDLFSNRPIINEEDMKDNKRFDHFLTQIYTWARFRGTRDNLKNLSRFHENNLLLLISRDLEGTRKLEQTLGRRGSSAIRTYEAILVKILSKNPGKSEKAISLCYALNLLKDKLTSEEINAFSHLIKRYKRYEIPLRIFLDELERLADIHGCHFISDQTFLKIYPRQLLLNHRL